MFCCRSIEIAYNYHSTGATTTISPHNKTLDSYSQGCMSAEPTHRWMLQVSDSLIEKLVESGTRSISPPIRLVYVDLKAWRFGNFGMENVQYFSGRKLKYQYLYGALEVARWEQTGA